MPKQSESRSQNSKEAPKNFTEALLRFVWSSRFKVLWLMVVALAIGLFTFFKGLPTELIIKPFLSEKIRVWKYDLQHTSSVELVQSAEPSKMIEGIALLQELAVSYPYKRQEIVNFLAEELLRKTFPQDKTTNEKYLPVLFKAIRTITTIPRYDDNKHPLNIDIHQIRVRDLNLTNTNFKGVSLWGNQFINVIFSRSNFQNADIGGTQFIKCSLEYANLEGAKITGSFMDKENNLPRPTRFIETKLYGSNLEKAEIDNGELINNKDFDLTKLKTFTDNNNLKIH